MKLSSFSDYSFRSLMLLGSHPDRLWTVEKLAQEIGASSHHIKKVIYKLSTLGYIKAVKGRGGGLSLGKRADEIFLSDVLKDMESNFDLFACFEKPEFCSFGEKGCKLQGITEEGLGAFFAVYEKYTLKDLLF